MPFRFLPNVTECNGANWSNFIKTVPNTTPQSAQLIAMADPTITFFVYCRQELSIEGHEMFNPGDSVFFSGQALPGPATQADIYEKDFFTTAYVEVNTNDFSNVGCYALEDGRQFFDIACIFAANINADADGNAILSFNGAVMSVLEGGVVAALQKLGISVLLTVLGNHQNAGWACFTEESAAQCFVDQLASAVKTYGLDGIDIDDEYSTCRANLQSLAMVTTLMKQTMPGKIISKALFDDIEYFKTAWKGHTLASNLAYGWQMSYNDMAYSARLQPYLEVGMEKDQLAIGVSTSEPNGGSAASFVKRSDYGGVMVYNVTSDSPGCLSQISNSLYAELTVAKPNCLG